eukprot:g83321.t1
MLTTTSSVLVGSFCRVLVIIMICWGTDTTTWETHKNVAIAEIKTKATKARTKTVQTGKEGLERVLESISVLFGGCSFLLLPCSSLSPGNSIEMPKCLNGIA